LNAVNVDGEDRAAGGAALKAEWTLVTLVLDGGNRLTVYKDGAKAGETSALASRKIASALFPSGSTVGGYLGKSFYAADPYFQGAIDDFRIYDSALSEAQVLELSAAVDAERVEAAADALDLGDTTALT